MPEILPSPDFGKNIDRCWTCRAMFMQAWGNYGTAWPVIHQQLGVAPDLGNGRLDVVPQVPAGQSTDFIALDKFRALCGAAQAATPKAATQGYSSPERALTRGPTCPS